MWLVPSLVAHLMTATVTPPAPAAAVAHPVPLPGPERARYVVRFGVFGDVGAMELQLTPSPRGGALHTRGGGEGAILGMASFAKQIAAELDPATGLPRRWTNERRQSDRTVLDYADQTSPGVVNLLRKRSDRPDSQTTMAVPHPVFDPLSFLVSLRTAPPQVPTAFRVLDGRGLWIVTITPGPREVIKVAGYPAPALKFACHAAPIDWGGSPDGRRDAQPFQLWLADDAYRTPLAAVAPMGLADVRVEATGVQRALTPTEILLRYLAHRGVSQPGGLPPAPLDRPRLN